MWTSPDGLVWTRVPDDTGAFAGGEDNGSMEAVAVGGSGVIAVGRRRGGGSGAWYSADGLTWQAGPHFGNSLIYDDAAVGTGAVAVGCTGAPTEGPAVWVSGDGTFWERAPDTGGVFTTVPIPTIGNPLEGILRLPSCVGMTAVAVGGPGVVAFGLDGSGGDLDVVVWVATVDHTP